MPFVSVVGISESKDDIIVIKLRGKEKPIELKFASSAIRDEAFGIITTIWKDYLKKRDGSRMKKKGDESSESTSAPVEANEKDDYASDFDAREKDTAVDAEMSGFNYDDSVTEEHWEMILLGGREVKFKKDEIILNQGNESQCIYQIVEGTCRVEKEGFNKVLARMPSGSTFGEMSFLLGGGASACVIADTDDVSVFIIEAQYFKRLFNERPDLAGRWFKYLATVLEGRFRRK